MEMLSRAEAEQRIRDKAESDADFRAQLKSDPRSALSAELGVEIPEEVTVHVHEETVSEVHLVLPPANRGSLRRRARDGLGRDLRGESARATGGCGVAGRRAQAVNDGSLAEALAAIHRAVPRSLLDGEGRLRLLEVARTLPAVLARRPVGLELRLAGGARADLIVSARPREPDGRALLAWARSAGMAELALALERWRSGFGWLAWNAEYLLLEFDAATDVRRPAMHPPGPARGGERGAGRRLRQRLQRGPGGPGGHARRAGRLAAGPDRGGGSRAPARRPAALRGDVHRGHHALARLGPVPARRGAPAPPGGRRHDPERHGPVGGRRAARSRSLPSWMASARA